MSVLRSAVDGHPDQGQARTRGLRTRLAAGLRRERLVGLLPTLVVLVALVVNAVELVHFSDKIWFWADDWDLLFRRGTIPGESLGLFAPHNSHWLTAHILVYRALFEVFGLRSYLPYAATEIAIHLAVCWVTYLLLWRVGARAWAAVGGGLLIAFFGMGANAEIFSATMNHTGSLLFGLLAAYAVVRVSGEWPAVAAVAVLLLVCVLFSGTGLALLVLVGVFATTQRGPWFAIRGVAPAAVAFAVWYLVHAHLISAWGGKPVLTQIPHYVWVGLTGTLGDGSGLDGSGPLFLALIVACLLVARPEPPALVALAGAGVVADLAQLVLLSVGRFGFGPTQLGTSHYAYINIVLLTPAVALVLHAALGIVRRSRWVVLLVAGALFAAYATHGWTMLSKWHDDFAYITSANDEIALGIRDAYEDGEKLLTDVSLDDIDHDFLPSYVITPQIRAALPDRTGDPQWRLEVESRFFTGVGTADYGLAQPADLEVASGLAGPALTAGCHQLRATADEPVLELKTGDIGNEIVVWSSSTTIKTKLYRDDLEADLREWKARPGAMHIATSAQHAILLISFDGAGKYTVCNQ